MVVGERKQRCVFVNMRCIRCFRDGNGLAVSDGSGDQDLGNAGSKLLCDLAEFRASQKLVLFDERLSANELAVPANRDQSDRRNAAKFWCVTYRNENEVRTTTDSTVKGSHLDNGVSNGV